jgi:hypothetical protein
MEYSIQSLTDAAAFIVARLAVERHITMDLVGIVECGRESIKMPQEWAVLGIIGKPKPARICFRALNVEGEWIGNWHEVKNMVEGCEWLGHTWDKPHSIAQIVEGTLAKLLEDKNRKEYGDGGKGRYETEENGFELEEG